MPPDLPRSLDHFPAGVPIWQAASPVYSINVML